MFWFVSKGAGMVGRNKYVFLMRGKQKIMVENDLRLVFFSEWTLERVSLRVNF
jgi:hypothetical protein